MENGGAAASTESSRTVSWYPDTTSFGSHTLFNSVFVAYDPPILSAHFHSVDAERLLGLQHHEIALGGDEVRVVCKDLKVYCAERRATSGTSWEL